MIQPCSTGPCAGQGITLALAVLLVVVAVLSIMRLRPTGSLESMMPTADPSARALGRIVKDFAPFDNLLLVARLPDARHADAELLGAFARRLEQAIDADADLRQSVRDIRSTGGPSAPEQAFFETRIIPASLYYLTDDQLGRFLQRLTPASMRDQIRRNEELMAVPGPTANALGRVLQKDPLRLREILGEALTTPAGLSAYDHLLLSADRRSLLIRITAGQPASDLDFTRVFLPKIRAAADTANTDGLILEYSGAYAIAATSERAIRSDMIRSVAASVLLIQLVFLAMHRMVLTFAVAFVPTAIAIVTAFGLHSVVRTELTPVMAVVGAVIAGLGVDYSIHVLSHYSQRRRSGDPPAQAAQTATREVAGPMLAAAGTTLMGVLAISLSPVRALRDFSIIALFGLGGALAAALTILPALLVMLERIKWRNGQFTGRFGGRWSFVGLTRMIERRARLLCALAAVSWCAALVFLAMQHHRGLAPIQTDLTALHPQPNPALDLQEQIARDFDVAANSLMVYIQSDSAEELAASAHCVAAASRTAAVRAAGVRGVYGLSTLIPDPRQSDARRTRIAQIDVDQVLRDFRQSLDGSAFSPAGFQQFEEFLARLLTADAPPDLSTVASHQQIADTVLPRRLSTRDGQPLEAVSFLLLERPLEDRAARDSAIDVVRAALRDVPHATLTGLSVVSHDIDRLIYADLKRQSLVAATAVLAMLALYVRHPLHLLLVLAPMACGLTGVLTALHLFNDGFNMINLVGIPLLMGIGDNFGLFVIDAFRRHRHEGAPARELAQRLAPSVEAITLTSAATILAFVSLVFTTTPAIQSLGRLTAIGVSSCLASTLFLLMPLTFLLAGRKAPA